MTNRIDEVAKLFFKRDCPDGNWDFVVPLQKEKWLKDARQIDDYYCQLFSVDDKDLREKALLTPEEIDQIYFECGQLNRPSLGYLNERLTEAATDKALALLQQKIEQEREKIIDFLEKHKVRTGAQKGWHISFTETTWQALKKGEK